MWVVGYDTKIKWSGGWVVGYVPDTQGKIEGDSGMGMGIEEHVGIQYTSSLAGNFLARDFSLKKTIRLRGS